MATIEHPTQHPLYRTFHGMVQRCTNARHAGFKYYGALGVKVCAEWLESFERFVADVGPKPSPRHSLDRFPDPAGDYRSGNVRWALPLEQGANKRQAGAPTSHVCAASRLLEGLLASSDESGRAMSLALGVSGAVMCRWSKGRRRPEHHHRVALERIYGIQADDWMTDDEFAIAFGRPRLRAA